MNKDEIKNLLNSMTLDEKIGQLYQTIYTGSANTGPTFNTSNVIIDLKKGLIGSILGLCDNKVIYDLQKVAVEETRLHIPLLFCNDIIHGCRTIFPINLAMSCSWNVDLIEKASKVAAFESSHSGVHLTFSPMLDLTRDPRWGRVMEGNGEDPYLSSKLASSYVKGYQQKNISGENAIASCAKHFVGYGACVGGRDYDSVDMSDTMLYNFYLPPFKEAINSDVKMVMSGFHSYNNLPVTGNGYLLKKTLRKKLKFKGVTISDYNSVSELINHKVCKNEYDAANLAFNAGLDIEMVSDCYINNLKELINNNKISLKDLDEKVYSVLMLKNELGLFENPYGKIYPDFEKYFLLDDSVTTAKEVASESIVLLENDGTLPLNKFNKTLFIGPFVDEKKVIGSWGGKANFNDTITLKEALDNKKYNYCYIENYINKDCGIDISEVKKYDFDTIVYTIGETQSESGESRSKVDLTIPKIQDQLLDELIKLNKKIILVIFAGRPLILTKYKDYFENKLISGIVYAWFLGTTSGEVLIDTLYGHINPSGKLSMTFPNSIGQIPIYYNRNSSGRPFKENENNEYRLRYIDCSLKPLYPFGYGKSYSNFEYSNIYLDKDIMSKKSKIKVSCNVTNNSNIGGKEIVQLYIECLCGKYVRPIKELKGFKKIYLKPKETKNVSFYLSYKDLAFYVNDKLNYDYGDYLIYLGPNSDLNNYCKIKFIEQ